ncbi:MAG TPA: hypothetical protein VKV28_17340 [Candidatus Binataceae bacterium]|nr:hypothetical protein [Candidatus Binataceae bacterium]
MARMVLLPTGDWPSGGQKLPGDAEIFQVAQLEVDKILAPQERLLAEGIPSPWARKRLMLWRLENLNTPEGREAEQLLRTLLLLQFLGALRPQVVELRPGSSGFQRLARVLTNDGDDDLIIWVAEGVGDLKDGVPVALSASDCLFFPSAQVEPKDLRAALLARFGPGSATSLVTADGEPDDPRLAATLRVYLGRLVQAGPGSAWARALEHWTESLRSTDNPLPIHELRASLRRDSGPLHFATWVDAQLWNCSSCARDNDSWTNHRGEQTLTANSTELTCPRHREAVRLNNGAGSPVTLNDLGCHLAGGELYIWNQPEVWPRQRTGSSRIDLQYQEIQHFFNLVTVTIKGRLVADDDVLLPPEQVAWVARRDGEDPYPADIPVRAEYASLIASGNADRNRRKWQFSLHGRGDFERPFPSRAPSQLWDRPTILVWPPKAAPGWLVDYVATAVQDDAARYRIVASGNNGRYSISDECSRFRLYRSEGRCEYIELGQHAARGFRPMGLMVVRREEVTSASAGHARVSLDFGTSSSAVLWQIDDEPEQFFRSGLQPSQIAEAASRVAFSEGAIGEFQRSGVALLQWYPTEPVRDYVPSLLAKLDRSDCVFIPPREVGLTLMRMSTATVSAGLKWRDWGNPAVRELVGKLVEQLLTPALWALKSRQAGSWSLRLTYPLAFEQAQGNKAFDYKEIVNDALDRLAKTTGVARRPETHFFSESQAAAAMLQEANVTHEVTLDLGGGTLDVAVLGGAAAGADRGKVLAADSLEYGARDFLHAVIVAYRLNPGNDDRLGGDDRASELLIEEMEVELQKGGINGFRAWLRSKGATLSEADRALREADLAIRWSALIAGMQLYVLRLLQGCIARYIDERKTGIGVSIKLLGQGWELLDFHEDRQINGDNRWLSVAQMAGEKAGAKQPAVTFQQTPPHLRKTAVALGARRLDPREAASLTTANVWALSPRPHKAFLGMAFQDAHGHELSPTLPLSEVTAEMRPQGAGDPGYARLLEELWEQVPVDLLPMVKRHLLQSPRLPQGREDQVCQSGDPSTTRSARRHITLRGENTFNQRWPAGKAPVTSPLADFLSYVWRPLWSRQEL